MVEHLPGTDSESHANRVCLAFSSFIAPTWHLAFADFN